MYLGAVVQEKSDGCDSSRIIRDYMKLWKETGVLWINKNTPLKGKRKVL